MSIFNGTTAPVIKVEFDLDLPLGPKEPDNCNWTAVSNDLVRSISIRRGKTVENQLVQPGELTMVLDNRSGDFDPMNSASPYWVTTLLGDLSYISPNLGVRVSATWAGDDYLIYQGYLEQISLDYGLNPTVTITCVDVLAWIAKQQIAPLPDTTLPEGLGDQVWYRCGRILDKISFPTGLRNLDASVSNTMYGTRYGADALSLLQTAADCGPARLFVDVEGAVRVMPWDGGFDANLVLSDSQMSGTVGYDLIEVDPGAKYLLNAVTVNKVDADGVTRGTVVVVDPDSEGRFGPAQATYDLPTNTATPVATFLAYQYSEPIDRVRRISFSHTNLGGNFVKTLLTDLADFITVERTTYDGRSLEFACHVEGIEHDITPESWQIAYICSTDSVTPIVTDSWFGALGFSSNTSSFTASTVDSSGNLIAAGSESSEPAVLLAKFDDAGSLLWQVTIPATDPVTAYWVQWPLWVRTDSAGNIYVICSHGFVFKCDPTGALVWQNQINGVDIEYYACDLDSSGSLYVTGQNPNGQWPVIKFDTTGTVAWMKNVTYGVWPHLGRGIAACPDGGVVTVGNATYGLLVKLDSSGTPQWARSFFTRHEALSVLVDGDGNIWAGARTNPGLPGPVVTSWFKFSSTGTLLWQKQGTIGDRLCSSDSDGNAYITRRVDWPGESFATNTVIKVSPDGDVVWGRSISNVSSTTDYLFATAFDSTESVYVSGRLDAGYGLVGRLPADGSKTGTHTITTPGTLAINYASYSTSLGSDTTTVNTVTAVAVDLTDTTVTATEYTAVESDYLYGIVTF